MFLSAEGYPMIRSVDDAGSHGDLSSASSALDRLADAHLILDAQGGLVTMNAAAERLLAVSRADAVGWRLSDWLVRETLRTAVWQDVLAPAKPPAAGQVRGEPLHYHGVGVMRADGTTIWCDLVLTRVTVPDMDSRDLKPIDRASAQGAFCVQVREQTWVGGLDVRHGALLDRLRALTHLGEYAQGPLERVVRACHVCEDADGDAEVLARTARAGCDAATTLSGVLSRMMDLVQSLERDVVAAVREAEPLETSDRTVGDVPKRRVTEDRNGTPRKHASSDLTKDTRAPHQVDPKTSERPTPTLGGAGVYKDSGYEVSGQEDAGQEDAGQEDAGHGGRVGVLSSMRVSVVDTLPVVDKAVLRWLGDDTGLDVLPSLTEGFAQDVITILDGVDAAMRHGDMDALRHHVHVLGGCAATFGAMRLHGVAQAVERCCQDGTLMAAMRLAESLPQEAETALTALDTVVSGWVSQGDTVRSSAVGL